MSLEEKFNAFLTILPPDRIGFHVSMKEHTTFRIGGNADILAMPSSIAELKALLQCAREQGVPTVVIGNGSNILVRDGGIRGLVICLCSNFSQITVEDGLLSAQSGASLSALAQEAARNGLSGLEFASGIPGTVGGGIYMNAGAYDKELKDSLVSVTALDEHLQIRQFKAEELSFSYRHSSFCDNNMLVLAADFYLKTDEKEAILQRMNDYNTRRRDKQPLSMPSAGSIFKRPVGAYAGALIEQAGLKGFSIGGAQVSPKHAGFIINLGNATAGDVLELISEIQDKVRAQFGVLLESEVRILGED